MPYRITKEQFYKAGGFSNPKLFRKQKGKSWAYYSYQSGLMAIYAS